MARWQSKPDPLAPPSTLYCEPDRSALCLVTVNRVSRRARYQDSGRLPDCFVEEALRDLAAQSAERSAALAEATSSRRPTTVMRARTLPARAHRAIARLVATGVVRVIITTNFDRLLEQAIQSRTRASRQTR